MLKQSGEELLANVVKLFKDGSDVGKDCVIITKENIEIEAHRIVLLQSPVLKEQILSSYYVNTQGPVTFMFPDVANTEMSAILNYFYTGVLKFNSQNRDKLRNILINMLKIPPKRLTLSEDHRIDDDDETTQEAENNVEINKMSKENTPPSPQRSRSSSLRSRSSSPRSRSSSPLSRPLSPRLRPSTSSSGFGAGMMMSDDENASRPVSASNNDTGAENRSRLSLKRKYNKRKKGCETMELCDAEPTSALIDESIQENDVNTDGNNDFVLPDTGDITLASDDDSEATQPLDEEEYESRLDEVDEE